MSLGKQKAIAFCFYLVLGGAAIPILGQSAQSQTTDEATGGEESAETSETGEVGSELREKIKKTLLYRSPWVSARAAAMSGAVSCSAYGFDAPYFNPAGIGGYGEKVSNKGLLTKFVFPFFGASANKNTVDLNKEFKDAGGANDKQVGRSLVDAAEGKRVYGRASFILGMELGRSIFVPYADQQIAAYSKGEDGQIVGHVASASGFGTGASLTNSKKTFFLGMYSFVENRTDYVGEFDYVKIIDTDERSSELKKNKYEYTSSNHNIGMLYRVPKGLKPAFSIVARNLGNTTLAVQSAPEGDPDAKDVIVKEDVTMGVSISPSLGNYTHIHWAFEATDMTDQYIDMQYKIRSGLEINFGQSMEDPILSIRGGYSKAGPSYGLGIYLGLINLEAAVESTHLGVDNDRYDEKRYSAIFYINVAAP